MPMIPEAMVAMLSVARIGAVHSVVFSGFGVGALAERIRDSGSRLVVTADGMFRRGKVIELKRIVDEAAEQAGTVEKVVVVRRVGLNDVPMRAGRDHWYHELVEGPVNDRDAEPERVRSEEPLFILYTSGTTGSLRASSTSTAPTPYGLTPTTSGSSGGARATSSSRHRT
jgi:acetyl-coenzyme A synthetase (EC 6.2.1.1)